MRLTYPIYVFQNRKEGVIHMKIVLESLRFTAIVFILLPIFGLLTHLIYPLINMNPEKYEWTALIGVFIVMFFIYRNRGWGQVFNKKILWSSIILVILLSIVLPSMAPEHLHTSKYAYSYGFPFTFLTIYIEDGTKFLLPNLFSGQFAEWSMEIGILGNILFFYFILQHFYTKKNDHMG